MYVMSLYAHTHKINDVREVNGGIQLSSYSVADTLWEVNIGSMSLVLLPAPSGVLEA